MAGFLSLPSKELAQERRRKCQPWLIGLTSFIGPFNFIFSFRQRNLGYVMTYFGISFIQLIITLIFPETLPRFLEYIPFVSLEDINFFIYEKIGAWIFIIVIVYPLACNAKFTAKRALNIEAYINRSASFPLKAVKTKKILKTIFQIDHKTATEIYQSALEFAEIYQRELPSIEDLNDTLMSFSYDLAPVGFCEKAGLKKIPRSKVYKFIKQPNYDPYFKQKLKDKEKKAFKKLTAKNNVVDDLEKITSLRDKGILTEEEFKNAKAKLLK